MSAAAERGVVVGKRYRLESVLGEGGMAVVWRAVHTETDRQVALKLVRSEFVTDDQVRDMFVREARIASRIGRSEHVIDVLDAGVDEQLGVPFMAMELLAGEPLDQRLKKRGPLDPLLCTQLMSHLGEALDQAHTAGVIHRDLKPQNLFICEDRKGKASLKVLDFGIAKLAEHAHDSSTHVGTPAYSAPEQLGPSWRGLAEQRGVTIASHVSAATDVWAIGLIGYEMLTASPSGGFWGATTLAELPVKIVLEPLPSARQRAGERAALLPLDFDAWMARCLELDATRRFPTAGETVAALIQQLAGMSALLRGHPAAVGHLKTAPGLTLSPFSGVASGPPPVPKLAEPPRHPQAGVALGVAAAPEARRESHTGAPAQSPSSHAQIPSGLPASAAADLQSMGPQRSVGFEHLSVWAHYRGAELGPGDPRLYAELPPLVHIPRVTRVPREARIRTPQLVLTFADVYVDDVLRQATSEDRIVVAIAQSANVKFRASLRSKRHGGGLVDGLNRGLRALDSMMAFDQSGFIRDPHFEHMFEVSGPSPAEAGAALPHAMRALLIQAAFSGVLELRVGLLVMTFFDPPNTFDAASLDRLYEASSRLIQTLG